MFSFDYGGRPSEEFIRQWNPGSDKPPFTRLDLDTGLLVTHDYRRLNMSTTVSTIVLTNTGDADTPPISNLQALDIRLSPYFNPLTLHRLKGSQCKADDWMPVDTAIGPGDCVEFSPNGGRSSDGESPFFNIDQGTSGIIIAVGWSGTWTASIVRDGQFARLRVGLGNINTILHPGESIRSPRVLMMHWHGNIEDSYNQFRRLMFDHIMPRVSGEVVTPPIASLSNSSYRHNTQTEEYTLDHLRSVRHAGFEVFWVDAYYTRGGFPRGMGNYGLPLSTAVDPDKFPNGMGVIGDAARAAGMGFMMWFEPERVNAGTLIANEHPEWLLLNDNRPDNYLLDLGNDEAREYVTEYLKAAVAEYGLEWLRFDFNIDPGPYWRQADDLGREGIHENRYIVGLYRMWDELRATFPHLKLDNCASGGRRIDLETCSRATPLWRSDLPGGLRDVGLKYAPAEQNQDMTAELSRYVPYNVCSSDGSSPYLIRSNYNAGFNFCEDARAHDYPINQLIDGIEECKRTRHYYAGNLYLLTATLRGPHVWSVRQYHLPDEDAGMVIAFRRPEAPRHMFVCELREIKDDVTYEVRWHVGYRESDCYEMSGDRLRELAIEIVDRPGSALIEYVRI